jgi:hypothetical protein
MDRKIPPMIFWLFLTLLLLPAPGLATTYNWEGGDGNWTNALSWAPDGVPGLADKAIINNGHTVTITSAPAGIFQLEVDFGNALNIGVSPGGAALWFQHSLTDDYILNNGTIRVGFSGYSGNIACWGDTVPIQGTGTLVLGGIYPNDALTGQGGSFINTANHTIRGGGYIQALSTNQGQVIADNGTLWIQCSVDNTGGTMSVSGSVNVLRFHAAENVTGGAIYPQDGKVVLTGSGLGDLTFGPGSVEIGADDSPYWGSPFLNTVTLNSGTTVTVRDGSWLSGGANHTTLINNGAIYMAGTSVEFLTYVYGDMTLQGPGTLTMGGPGNVVSDYYFVNSAPHTIQGGGSIEYIVNDGAIIANNGTLTVSGVTGTGMVDVANGATLSVTPMNLQTGYLTLAPQATLVTDITSGLNLIDLKGDFTFFQIDPTKWNWGTNGLNMSGGTWLAAPQTLEVGCRDDGTNASGYTNNFVLPNLQVTGANTFVSLVDAIDNGHRASGREALYVTTLQVTTGATLNLNGLKLYAKRGGSTVYRVRAGEGSLYGDGRIIDKGGFLPAVDLMLLD